jgi:ABC-type antimicrobial peptide transport system permease subunit
VYVSNKQDHWGGGSVYLRTSGDPSLAEASARAAVRRVDPALAVTGMSTMEATRERLLGDRRLPMQLMMAFAVVALVLSLVGVYGVTAHGVAARAREFGIRMALGATPRAVLRVALNEGTLTAGLGLLIGTPLALVLAWRLRGMLYQVRPFDPQTLAAVAVLLAAVTLLAALVPARRATRVDPAVTLRDD